MLDKVIKCKDFAPQPILRGPFGGVAEVEPFSQVVSAANQWIENQSVQVINVETVALPQNANSTNDGVYGFTIANGTGLVQWYQCVRVWYRE